MSFGLLLLAFTGAVNPCRVRLGFRGRRDALALGALVALVAGAALTAIGGGLLDALEVSPESFRLAAGLVLTVEGIRALVLSWPRPEAGLPGLGASLVPVAFPLLLQPGVVTLALAAGGDGVEAGAIVALAAALGLAVLTLTVPDGPRAETLLTGGARLLGALEIAAGAALAVDAVRDV